MLWPSSEGPDRANDLSTPAIVGKFSDCGLNVQNSRETCIAAGSQEASVNSELDTVSGLERIGALRRPVV